MPLVEGLLGSSTCQVLRYLGPSMFQRVWVYGCTNVYVR